MKLAAQKAQVFRASQRRRGLCLLCSRRAVVIIYRDGAVILHKRTANYCRQHWQRPSRHLS